MERIASIAIATLLILSACGTRPGERALSGAGIGAAGGAVVGAVAGNPLAGAVIGGAGGAAVGALTSPRQVYLGRPAWK